MKPDATYLLDSLSNNDATFFIPPYQRNYEWKESTCKVFLDDVKKVTASNLNGVRAEHFFGSIVYVVEESGFGVPSRYILTDGQQRITTTMLFLMALRDSIEDKHYQDTIQNKYIQNDSATTSTEFKIKLKQVETDWTAYKSLALSETVPEELHGSAVYQNYDFFRRSLKDLGTADRKNLLECGLIKFQVITIRLEPKTNPWENPQEIFESMNSLGQPLALADLVRNYLLMGKSSDEQVKLYNQYWLKLEKQLPGRLSDFIRDWMQADQHRFFKVAKESNYKELYSNFKELVKNRETSDVFESLAKFARPYSQAVGLENTGTAQIDTIISDIALIGTTTVHSLVAETLLKLNEGKVAQARVLHLLESLRTYILRRRILQLSAGENKFFPTVGLYLDEMFSSERPGDSLLRHLSSWEYAIRLPNDADVEDRLRTMNFYNFGVAKTSPRLILSMVEEHLTKSRPKMEDDKMQLEHILPQTLTPEWRSELGDNADELHRQLLNNIGNITLIRHNQELGNKPFSEKKEVYESNSGIQVSQNMICKLAGWNAETITARADYLIDLIVKRVLPVPEELKRGSNWKQAESTEAVFDSRRVLAQLLGETIAYSKDPRITATVLSGARVMFEGKEWSLSPLTRELRRREGEENSSSAYQGAYYWTWEDTKLINI
jgi:hypothetical protein